VARGCEVGEIRNRSGKPYKPSALRGYEESIRTRLLPSDLARLRVPEVRRMDVQDFADGLLAEGFAGSTVANILNPLQAMYRRLIRREVSSPIPPSISSCRDHGEDASGSCPRASRSTTLRRCP
jgi:hypothetical protein